MPELTTVKVVAVRFPVCFFGGGQKRKCTSMYFIIFSFIISCFLHLYMRFFYFYAVINLSLPLES